MIYVDTIWLLKLLLEELESEAVRRAARCGAFFVGVTRRPAPGLRRPMDPVLARLYPFVNATAPSGGARA